MVSSSYAAAMLTPPPLTSVIAQNEQQLLKRLKAEESLAKPTEKPAITQKTFDFYPVYTGSSITIKKAHGANFWIQEVDLAKWARVESVLDPKGFNPKTGEPQFQKKNISETLAMLPIKPTSLINWQFFNPKTNPTELSFGLKVNGEIRSAGADNGREKKNILIINKDYAEVLPYSWENLRDSKGDFALVNLAMSESHYPKEYLGRTYTCLKDPVEDRSSKLLIFIAEAIQEKPIQEEMIRQGCNIQTSSKLDSSGSTRFWFSGAASYGNSHNWEPDRRKIPHSIVFYEN